MDIVLGVSLTPKTVRMVLVEGVEGDGAIVDHDTFDVSASSESATSNAADSVVAAVLGTQESAAEGGHELTSIGVTWSDRTEAAELRDALAARGIRDVILVSELHAAGALAQAAGRAVGYDSTALLFIDKDSATLSVVRTGDGSIVKVLSRDLHSTDAMGVLADMVSAVEAQDAPPQGMFVVGSGVDISSVKEHLEGLVALPVRAPEEAALALARGAALAAANAPKLDATTAGLAYSLDPDGATASNEYGLASAVTMLRPVGAEATPVAADYGVVNHAPVEEGRKPFLLVGSALTSIFVVGVVGLVISLAVSIRPTVDQRPDPGRSAIIPEAAPPVAPIVPEVQLPAPAPPPTAETIKPPVPVVQQQQAPSRTVVVEAPPVVQAPPPAAPPPIPVAPPPAPPPVYTPPVILPPPVIFPPVWRPPVYRPPVYDPPNQGPPWQPPWQQWPPRPQQPPQHDDDDWPQYPPQHDDDDWPQYPPPQAPQYPQYPQYPQQGSGGSGGDGRGPGSSGSSGRDGNDAPKCFLIFCG